METKKLNKSDEHIQLGLTYFALGRYGEAIEEYKKAKEIDANNLNARYYLAIVYGKGKEKRTDEAISELEAIVKVNPQSRLSCLLLGDLYYDLKNFPESERWYVEALKIKDIDSWEFSSLYRFAQIPYHARVHEQLGYIIERQGRIPGAIEHHKKAIEIDPTYLIPRYNLGLNYVDLGLYYLNLGFNYLMLATIDEAIKQFHELLNIEPFYRETFFHLGRAYYAKGDLENAVFYLQKELQNNPGYADAQYLLEMINQRALDINPNNSRAADAFKEIDKKDSFPGDITKRKKVNKDEMDLLKKYSIQPELQENDVNIKALWEKYYRSVTEGMMLSKQGMFDEAIRIFNQAKNGLPKTGAEFEKGQCDNMISLTFMAQGKYEEALALNEEVVILYKKIGIKNFVSLILTNRGLILNYYSKHSKAIEVINKALKVCKDASENEGISCNLGNLGISYMELGDIERAIKYHQEALAIDIQNNFTENVVKDKGNLATCYFRLMLKEEDGREFDKLREKAEKFQNDIVDYYKKIRTDKIIELEALTSLAAIKTEVGRRNKNRDILNRCLNFLDDVTLLSNKIKEKGSLLSIFRLKGIIYRYLACLETDEAIKLGHLSASERFLREANSRVFEDSDLRFELGKTYKALSEAQENAHALRLRQAYLCYEEAINDIERNRGEVVQQELKMSVQGLQKEVFEESVQLCIEMEKKQISIPSGDLLKKAFAYIEGNKSRTLIEMLGMTEIQPPGDLKSELLREEKKYISEIRSIRARLVRFNSDITFASDDNEQLREAMNKLDEIYNQMEKISPDTSEYVFSRRGRPIGFEEVKKCIRRENV